MTAINTTTNFDILMKGQVDYLTCFVRDPKSDELQDVHGISNFTLIDISTDTSLVTGTFVASGGTNIVHQSAGVYQYSFDSTAYSREYIASFKCVLEGDTVTNNLFVKSVPSRYFKYAAALRVQVDKARKSISDDVENADRPEYEPAIRFFYGYSDAHMIFYLERGVQIINAVPPYTSFTVDTFPFDQYGTTLIDAATIAALESQGIFAIDTDYNYSLGGNSLVIDHFTKINTMLSTILGRFEKSVLQYKQQYRSKGLVMYQFMPGGVRSARQLSAMPAGFYSRMLSASFV